MLRCVARCLPGHVLRRQAPSAFRFLSITQTHRTTGLSTTDPPVFAIFPADAFQLLSDAEKVGATEDGLFEAQVNEVKQWWATPRYSGIRRPYSAEDVVRKRGALQQSYPSSLMARKLFNLFHERATNGEPVHTSSCNLPVPRSF